MYSSGYSQVNKYSPQTQKKLQYRSKGKSCGYYMRIIFFFSSLIQSLIIVSLVLFLVYGKKQDSASETRVHDLEQSFSRLSLENVALREQRKNLTNLLNATLTDKARNDFDLANLRHLCNISFHIIGDMERKMQQCHVEILNLKMKCISPRITGPPLVSPGGCNCGLLLEQVNARYDLLQSNFTQTTQRMKMKMDQTVKERDNLNLETIRLRRDKSIQEKEIEEYKRNSKREISITFGYVKNVSTFLREKIESLFPRHIAFQLTCLKQREHLEQIHTNCTSLSREVEDKLQRYLNTVGEQMSTIESDNYHLKAENLRLNEDYRECSQNRTAMAEQHRRSMKELREKYDKDKEQLLMDKLKLDGEKEVLVKTVKYKDKENDLLKDKVNQLNMSCMLKPGGLGFQPNTNLAWNVGGGSSSSIGTSSSFSSGSTGIGSMGSLFPSSGSTSSLSNTGFGFNKPGSTGTGSSSSLFPSSGSTSSLSNTGFGFNKPVTTGTGSSSSLFPSSGSSSSLSNTGLRLNKPGSTGTGSLGSLLPSSGSSSLSNTGLGLNKPQSTGGDLSSLGSTGLGSSLSSSGTGLNKPGVNGRVSTVTGSSSSSLGSSSSLSGIGSNKPASNSKTSWFTFGSSAGSSSAGSSSAGSSSSSGSSTSSGSASKSGSTSSGYSWLGNSNSGQSKTGSTTGKTSSGASYGGTGTPLGGVRTSGLVGGSVTQHLQTLLHVINPSDPQEKQDLSRMLG